MAKKKAGPAKKTILVVDDHTNVRTLIKEYLTELGYRVVSAGDGAAALAAASREPIDLILLDVMMPNLDGFAFLKIYRKEHGVPIILLTARLSEADKVLGLELGADDYVTKPFGMQELVARIRAVLRRNTAEAVEPAVPTLAAGPVRMDVERHVVSVSGENVPLPLKEFELLELLLRNAGRVLTRGQLIDRVWGADYVGDTKTLDVHVKRLRSKIEPEPSTPRYLVTVRGLGYKFEP
jgi:two-component system response regulator RegX3